MNRQPGLLRQHELRATQQVVMQQSTQSLGRIQEYSSTPPQQSQHSAQETNMFITHILDECGLEIKMADEENMHNNNELNLELKVDQGLLAKRLSQRLRSPPTTTTGHNSIPLKKFETELVSFFSNDSIFRSSLLPTSSTDDVSPLRSQQQDSLMRILLCVDEIQMFLAKYLLKRLIRFDNKGGDRVIVQNLPLSMIRLILQTFHYLPLGKLTNAKDLLYFYLDIIDLITNNDIRCQMIALVTDIFCDDHLQMDIVKKLEEKFDSNNIEMIKQVLRTLGTIQLDDLTERRVREKIIPMLTTSIQDVKVECFNYLFETSSKMNMFETVLLFRDVAIVSARRSDQDNFPSVQILFERFEYYFHSSRILFRTCQEKHPITADLCLKINSYFLFDFFVGILLTDRSYYTNLKTFIKKLGEDPSIIRKIYFHLTANLSFVIKYAQNLFRFAVAIFQQLSFGNFPTITTTNSSLCSANLLHLQIGLQLAVMIVDLLFQNSSKIQYLTDFHEQIISTLVRMVIIFQNRYIQRLQILKLLKRFCYRYKTKMFSCESYLKNLFEYIDIFRGDHLRLVFAILASMYNTGVYNDLNMFVTKCLIQPHKEKARGVFGAIEIFRSLLVRHVNDMTQSTTANNRLDGKMSNHENELKDLLSLVQSSGMQCPQTLALFYDELANILGAANAKQLQQQENSSSTMQIDIHSLNWFAVSAADMFQEAFLNDSNMSVSTNSLDNNRFPQQTRIVYNFDGQISNATVLNLAAIISKYHQYRTMSDTCSSPILLAPMLRLIVLASWSNIDQVDAVLQCSLRIPDILNDSNSSNIDIDSFKSLQNYKQELKQLSHLSLNILCDVYYYASRLFREICNLFCLTNEQQKENLICIRLEQLTDIEENFSICVQICRQQYGFYEPISANITRIQTIKMRKITKKLTTVKISKKSQGIKRPAPTSDDEDEEDHDDENKSDEEENVKKKPRTTTAVPALKTKSKMKLRQQVPFDIYQFDIRPLEQATFSYVSKYLERLSKSTGKQRLVILRCVTTLMGDLHRLLTSNSSSMSSMGIVKKRYNTHTVPSTLQTQQIRVSEGDEDDEIDANSDDKLDFMTFNHFEMLIQQVILTLKHIHIFLGTTTTNDDTNNEMDTDDDSNLIDCDQSRDLASRAFYYALDSLYFLLTLFKVKQSNWQKDLDNDSTCLIHLLKLIMKNIQIIIKKKTESIANNDRVTILQYFFNFADICNLIDSTRLCQSLELFIQLFEDDDEQDELYAIYTLKCRQFLEERNLDVTNSTVVSFSKTTPVRAVEILLNLYLLHLDSVNIIPVIDGIIHYSLKIYTRAEKHLDDDENTTNDDSSDSSIVDLSTWNMKSTFIIYFRCLFKHLIIKARSIKLPNENKKKKDLENICNEWLELNELFRKFVSFAAIDQLYAKNATVISTILRFAKQYIDVFRARAMPTLDIYFLQDPHGTKQLLTTLQKSTRLLQSLCNLVKQDQKHMSCIRLVPALKRTLEMLMCRAKLMVDINNCPANVFSIGQLKAKDLKGNELTDVTYRHQQDEDETSSIVDDDSNDVQPDQDEDEEENDEESEEE